MDDARKELAAKVKELEKTYGKGSVQGVVSGEKPLVEIIDDRWLLLRWSGGPTLWNLDHINYVSVHKPNSDTKRKEDLLGFYIGYRKSNSHVEWDKREIVEKTYQQILDALRAADKMGMLLED